jgi:hypothetical protein
MKRLSPKEIREGIDVLKARAKEIQKQEREARRR